MKTLITLGLKKLIYKNILINKIEIKRNTNDNIII
jgi:hypothetical protein